MKTILPMKSADEYDALTKWKKFIAWRPGQRKRIKNAYNRRIRRQGDLSLHRLHTTKYEDLCM